MRIIKLIIVVNMLVVVTACTSTSTQYDRSAYLDTGSNSQASDLFVSQGDMTDQEIANILNYHLQLPVSSRLAILHLSSNPYWRFYSHDFAQLSENIATDFIGSLRSSQKLFDASYLPTLLIPEQRTLPNLRAAAARYQADLLLLYRDQCGSFEKYRLFAADESRAYCSVEAVLLDIRSGIIPFTSVATESFDTRKLSEDKNFRETIKKGEMEALARALQKIATDLNTFLSTVS